MKKIPAGCLCLALLAGDALAGDVRVDRPTVPATGRQETVVTVAKYGRYAFSATSAQGTAVHIVDRMTGPGAPSGSPGVSNGRLDVFLDRGTYRLVATSDPHGSGEAKLDVRAFDEQNGEPPILVTRKPVDARLADFQRRSWWITVDDTRPTPAIEAAGRSLADLRLWRDGSWLVDATPTCTTITPTPAKPLRDCLLSPKLEPGLYLLVAYGGAPLAWSETSEEMPFHLRSGLDVLPETGRSQHVMGPLGFDRWLVPGTATNFRLELPTAADATLRVNTTDMAQPFRGGGSTAAITKKSALPVAETSLAGAAPFRTVTVTGAPGQPYVLQHYKPVSTSISVQGDGEYWLSTVHTGTAGDAIDATGALTPVWTKEDGAVPVATSLVPISASLGYKRRFNLLEGATLFLDVREEGTWNVRIGGVAARWRVEPVLSRRPERYAPPPWTEKAGSVELKAGPWMLVMDPVEKGIAELEITPGGWKNHALGVVGMGPEAAARPPLANVQFPEVSLLEGKRYTLELNRQPGVKVGMILRKLPMDLIEPLALSLRPGEPVAVRARMERRGTLRAVLEDGRPAQVAVDGGGWSDAVTVGPGEHRVNVRQDGATTLGASLALELPELRADAPQPRLPEAALAALPDFPVLGEKTPRFLDLGRGASATFKVRVDAPALYRVESTGLLSTAGRMRTRIVPTYGTASHNGVGRNFLLGQYLREGDYQVTVTAEGESTGHLGLRLKRNTIHDGGMLTDGVPARIALPADEGVIYRFDIAEEGDYTLRALGQKRTFKVRLEDADGWPLTTPDIPGDLTWRFLPGSYRLMVLPEATPSRRLTLLARVPDPVVLSGHGPHPLALDAEATLTWREPADGGERVPDRWSFVATAPMEATIAAGDEMAGMIVGPGETVVGRIIPGKAWAGRLETGLHRLELVSAHRGDRVAYTVRVTPAQLVPGITRSMSAGSAPLSIGEEALVSIASFGPTDVRARLYDAGGALVAADDDRPEDWNFQIFTRLKPGRYRLDVDTVGSSGGSTEVRVDALAELTEAPLREPRTLALGAGVHVFPLSVAANGLLVATATSADNVGLAIDVRSDTQTVAGWRTLDTAVGHDASVQVRLAGEGTYRARLWSLDRRGNPVQIRVDGQEPLVTSEGALRSGVGLRSAGAWSAARVRLDRPGVVRLEDPDGLRWCPTPGERCREVPGELLAAGDGELWLLGPAGSRATAERFVLTTEEAHIRLPDARPVVVDLATGAGPVVLVAEANGAVPGVRVQSATEPAQAGSRGMAVASDRAIAAAMATASPVGVLFPTAAGAGGAGLDVRVRALSFPAPVEAPVGWGLSEAALAAGAGASTPLPNAPWRLGLALAEGLVAVITDPRGERSVHWAHDGGLDEEVAGNGGRLVVLNPSGVASRYTLELLPGDPDGGAGGEAGGEARPEALALDASVERITMKAGTLRFGVPAARGATLHVRGPTDDVTLIRTDGTVDRGRDIVLGAAGGTLIVRHGPGLVLAWLDSPGREAEVRWGAEAPLESLRADLPSDVALSGPAVRLRFSTPGPGMLHLRTPAPVVAQWRAGEAAPRVEVLPGAGIFDAPVPGGSVDVQLRAIGGASLWGSVRATFTPAIPVGEGAGPEILLAAGATRLFSFEATRAGPVGLGVRGEADRVECVLYDAGGERLGAGVVQMATLPAGRYYVALHLPESAAPVRARLAVVGLELPDTGPPMRVIRQYGREAGLIPAEPEAPDGSFGWSRSDGNSPDEDGDDGDEEYDEEQESEEGEEHE